MVTTALIVFSFLSGIAGAGALVGQNKAQRRNDLILCILYMAITIGFALKIK